MAEKPSILQPGVGGQLDAGGIQATGVDFPHGGALTVFKKELARLEIATPENAVQIDIPAGFAVLVVDPDTAAKIRAVARGSTNVLPT